MRRIMPALAAACSVVLSACAVAASTPTVVPSAPADAPTGAIAAGIDPFASGSALTRMDDQGAVVIEVTPGDLSSASGEIEFEIAMNTHSIDLSMDLAALSSISTDRGVTVGATSWDGPVGGHHVSGKLVFPANKDGKPVLAGATRLTLTIKGVDAPSRVFEWELE